jgi:heptosyltransferase-2
MRAAPDSNIKAQVPDYTGRGFPIGKTEHPATGSEPDGDRDGANSHSAGTSRTLVIQPLPGIGDTIWHLPHMRAIARAAPEGKIRLLTKARSLADRLLAADPAIEDVLWLHRNKGVHDGVGGFFRLTDLLRQGRFERVWVLHNSVRYAQAVWAAGIPERHGYGAGTQSWYLNRSPYITAKTACAHPINKADELLDMKGLELRDHDKLLSVSPDAASVIAKDFGHLPKPWVAFGLGSSESFKQWGAERFAALAGLLQDRTDGTLFLLGGPSEREIGDDVEARIVSSGGTVQSIIDRPIDQVVALLSAASLYIGNDTGVANISAAVDTDTIILFGATAPLTHSPRIRALLPDDPTNGMAGISPDKAMREIDKIGIN